LEAAWIHIITNIVTVSSDDNWLRKVKDVIDKEQGRSIWVAEEGKVLTAAEIFANFNF